MTREQRQYAWLQCFCAVKGWQYHPGMMKAGQKPLTTGECAMVADDMLQELEIRGDLWDGLRPRK